MLPGLRNKPFRFFLAAVVFFAGNLARGKQVVAQVSGGVAILFRDAVALDERLHERRENNLHVTEESDSLYVLQVVLDFLFPGDGIPAINLGKSAQPLPYGVAFALFGSHEHHVAHELRPRADYRHVALQYVEEFGEFIKAGGA